MSTMTATERIIASSAGEPDRVPVVGISIDWAWGQLYGKDSFLDIGNDAERLAKCIVWLCKEVHVDAPLAVYSIFTAADALTRANGLNSGYTLKWKEFVPTDPHSAYEGDPIKDIAYGNPLIKTVEDAMDVKLADPYADKEFAVLLKAIELANKEMKGEYPIASTSDDLISVLGQLMGWTQLFMAIDKNDKEMYKIYKILLDVVFENGVNFSKALCKAGAGAIACHTEMPHKIGAEKFFKNKNYVHLEVDLQLEFMKRLLSEFQVGFVYHGCTVGPIEPGIGVWRKVVDKMGPAGGAITYNLGECGGADSLATVKKGIAPASVSGNIHPVDIMLHGTSADVEEASIDLIKKCGPGGRFQLATGCMIPLDTPFENVKAMVDSAAQYGQYPISI